MSGKLTADERVAQLEATIATIRKSQGRKEQRVRFRATQELIPKVVEEGRRLFADFDSVVAGVPVDPAAFQLLILSSNGAELVYALGLGMKAIGLMRQLQSQAQADRERLEYYRRLHHQHFAVGTEGHA